MSSLTDWRKLHGNAFENQKALVTGGAGFIGSHLAIALNELGAKVTVLDDLSGGGNPEALTKGIEFVKGSILDVNLLGRCTALRQLVFHQAALGSVPRSIEQPRLYHDVNAVGTLNVLEAARSGGVKRVMFAASSSAYGESEALPKVESMPPQPLSPYAANKAAGEALLAAYAHSFPIDTVSLRYFNIFGPRQSADNAYAAVIAAFAKSLFAGKRPTIFGDGEQSRDFTFVDNVVHANLLAAKKSTPIGGEIVNIACGKRITVNQLATDMASRINRPDLTAMHAPERAGDVKHSLADLTVAKNVLGYTPIVDFAPGLDVTMKWYQSVY